MKLGAAAQATSRTFFALNRQVRVGLAPGERGRVNDRPTSDFAMMGTVVSDFSAVARRARCVGVSTSAGVRDRESTRLNSRHSQKSYAVFFLKKKKHGNAHVHTL